MRKILRLSIYLLSFAFARGALFFSPILLANFLSTENYGIFELSHATATMLASFATLGTAAALPLLRLKNVGHGSISGVITHHLLLAVACSTGFVIAIWIYPQHQLLMCLALLCAIALQSMWSVYLKTEGYGEASLLLDAGLFSILALIATILYFSNQKEQSYIWMLVAVVLYALTLLVIAFRKLIQEIGRNNSVEYIDTLKISFPLMIGAIVTIAVTTSGRLLIGYLGGALFTADFAVLARAGALPIIAHQVIMVAKFRHLYTLDNRQMERVMLMILGAVLLSIFCFSLAIPYFSWMLGGVYQSVSSKNFFSAIVILGQAVLWSAISLNDTVNAREQKLKAVLPWCIGYILIAFPIALIIIESIGLSLKIFVLVHSVVMLLFYGIQSFSMYKNGIRLFSVWLGVFSSFTFLIFFAYQMYF